MKRIYQLGLIVILLNFLTSCNGQTKNNNQNKQTTSTDTKALVGGGCDGCELMYVDLPTNISSIDTSAGWTEIGQKTCSYGKSLPT